MSNQQASTPSHRSLTGYVTKLVGDCTYGFIDETIFFPQTNVTGGPASVGDQVYAECEYSAHLPIKWNATSVKILNKANQQQQQPNNPIYEQQDLLLNQQQFNPTNSSSVAVTYQQHRQQKQQRQLSDGKQDGGVGQQDQQNEGGKLLGSTSTNLQDYYGQVDSGRGSYAQPQQQQDTTTIQPFQDQTPMGPPFAYTSQLGSAFVQNQFVPFLQQPPPPMLPSNQIQQHQQPQQQQQQQHNQRNNHQQHNKGQMNNRYNNNQGGEKNDRQNSNRRNLNNRGNNDNRFDRPRSGDRDNRSSKSNNNQSIGRNSKREDSSHRPSPPSHSSARSNSINSDRGTKSKRHYDLQNIPKTRIMSNMNAYNMKQRCSFVHVPSDLKDIIVNKHFRLDIKNTPKPIKFIIEEQLKNEAVATVETKDVLVTEEAQATDESTAQGMVENEDATVKEVVNEKQEDKVLDGQEVKPDKANDSIVVPPPLKSDLKLNHKYGVKVVLMSLPEMKSLYNDVFGPDLDPASDNKSYSRLDECITLLCNKGSNNGHSLIGGKFDPTLDGFVEGVSNEFERNGLQPDLIATCRRSVLNATGLDLSECKNWTLLSTFMYNNKSDYFSPKASIEYSFIYMPQLWTMKSDKFDSFIKTEQHPAAEVETDSSKPEMEDQKQIDHSPPPPQTEEVKEETDQLQPGQDAQAQDPCEESKESTGIQPEQSTQESDHSISVEQLSELKVTDLKAELDRRNIKYKGGLKKAELVALLQETIQSTNVGDVLPDQVQDPAEIEKTDPEPVKEQLEEGEVEAPPSDDSMGVETTTTSNQETSDELASKRKLDDNDDDEIGEDEPDSKKVCTANPLIKEKRVELISEPFVVRARDEQQQLSLVCLHEAARAGRHDQFELTVTSSLLKESLIQHLSEYILTTLVEDHRLKTSSSSSSGTQSNSSSQETSSDTNNNNNNNNSKLNSKDSSSTDPKANLKELPIDRYINLAFSYFDSNHMGYMYFEDLNKLFNNTGLTISKRALLALLGDGDKFNYRCLPDQSHKNGPTFVYEFPKQFTRLPGQQSSTSAESSTLSSKMVEYQGVTYDVEKLVQQVKDADTLRNSLVERFNYAIENSDKQTEEIHVLEVSQKSLARAIKAQNDEICDLKRERDSFKKKLENLRKGIKGTVTSLSDLMKDEK